MSQKSLCGELHNVNVGIVVLSFHLSMWCKSKMQGVDWKNVCECILSAVSTWCQRKTHMNGLKKCLFVRINFHVVEPSTPLMLWKI